MATADQTTGILSTNTTTEVFLGRGKEELCIFSGDFSGGAVKVYISHDNGGTWNFTGDEFYSDASFRISPAFNKYKFTLFGATLPSINYCISVAI